MAPEEKIAAQGFAVRRAPVRSRKGLFLRTGVALLAAGIFLGGGWWLRTSPVFAVKRVESGAYRFTSQQDLESTFGAFLGRNIWTVSLAAGKSTASLISTHS